MVNSRARRREKKLPYKQDFIAALLAAKEQGIGAMLAFIMALCVCVFEKGQASRAGFINKARSG